MSDATVTDADIEEGRACAARIALASAKAPSRYIAESLAAHAARAVEAERANATSMKCPFCDKGYCGVSGATGEAIDCHACDGHGVVTQEIFKDAVDARECQAGDLMAIYGLAEDGQWDDLKSMLLAEIEKWKEQRITN